MTSINGNDDDLFDYDPEDDTEDLSSESFKTNQTNPVNNDYVNTVKQTIENADIDTSETSGVNSAQVKISDAFNNGTYHWIHESYRMDPHHMSSSYVLDKMTNGDFTKIELFYETEHKLARKILVDFLMKEVFCVDGSLDIEGSGIQAMMKEMFDIEVSDFYMKVVYENMYRMNLHSIKLDRIVYSSLADALSMDYVDALFHDDLNISELYESLDYEKRFNDLKMNIIIDNVSSSILEELNVRIKTSGQDKEQIQENS